MMQAVKSRLFPIVLGVLMVGGAALGVVVLGSDDRDGDVGSKDDARPSSVESTPSNAGPSAEAARYVGSAACGVCHQEQLAAHRGSHHDRAIEEPSKESVLAPFAGETFRHDGGETTFFREGSRYLLRTTGKSGKLETFPVAYTFGVQPLQQYLLDTGGGRLQAFTVAWDSRPRDQGGQRYFSLYPDEKLSLNDDLHFTRPIQNWNFTCADCHSTGLRKGYDARKDSFEPSFGELDVGCEACHGPGSRHAQWAKTAGASRSDLDPQGMGLPVALEKAETWLIPAGAKNATPRGGGEHRREVDTCAPCHSRRQQLREGRTPAEPLLDAYVPSLLAEGLYHADGQILDEVYVYGSFLQSRMYRSGVRCSDCHDPHSLKLRRDGNALCGGCHEEAVYDAVSHHHHEETGQADSGSACVDCHMPETTYMQVDPRRDHSLRVPRPDLFAATGAPDACTGCHDSQSPSWAARRLAEWFGGDQPAHYGEVLKAARGREPKALARLTSLVRDQNQPVIVRATGLSLLANYPEGSTAILRQSARSDEALIRLGVTQGALGLPPDARLEVLRPLLDDRLLGVRTEAARALVGIPNEAVSATHRSALSDAFDELARTEEFYADRPDAWLRIGLLELGRGRSDRAEQALERALELDERFVPALVNLADLRRIGGDEEEARALLRRAVGIDEQNAEAWHALGLSLVRSKEKKEANLALARAAQLRPDNPRFAYVYAIALADGGNVTQAIAALQAGLVERPHDRNLLHLLMNYAKQAGDTGLASEAAMRLAGLDDSTADRGRATGEP